MKVGDKCVVISEECCGGHPIGSIVEVVDYFSPGETDEKIEVYSCKPLKNSNVRDTLYQCNKCLVGVK